MVYNKEHLRIVFLGTPDFAVATLDALLQNGFHVVAVVTAPDKPSGRGLHMHASAVKTYAVSKQIPVLQPEKLKNPEFIAELKSYNADLQVVVAFRMLPELVWNMPPLGTFNVHASLLPQYRGAAPINRAIMNGESVTGVTTFKLVHEIDKGHILLQKQVAIGKDDNAGLLHDKLMLEGGQLMVETIEQLVQGNLKEIPQSESDTIQHAPKIFTQDCELDWTQSCTVLYNQIRGLSPYPGALTQFKGKILKVYEAGYTIETHDQQTGTFSANGKNELRVACSDGFILLKTLQLEGKKKMGVAEFLNGNRQLLS